VAQEGSDQQSTDDDSSRLHQHILLGSFFFKDSSANGIKANIKKVVLDLYPAATGNAGHSIKIARSKQCLAQYVLKDGLFKQKGFTQEFIDKAKLLSFNHKDAKKQFVLLLNKVIVGEISYVEYTREFCHLKAVSGQNVYRHHIHAHFLSIAMRLGELDSTAFADAIVFNIFNPPSY